MVRDGRAHCAPPRCHLHQALGFLSCLSPPSPTPKSLLSHSPTQHGENLTGDHSSPAPFPTDTEGQEKQRGRKPPVEGQSSGRFVSRSWELARPAADCQPAPIPGSSASQSRRVLGLLYGFLFVLVLKRAAFGLTVRDTSRALPRPAGRWRRLQILTWLKRVP